MEKNSQKFQEGRYTFTKRTEPSSLTLITTRIKVAFDDHTALLV